jgi:flagellar hook-associated protein 1 FlgK
MATLFATFGVASSALDALQQAIGVVQNNVSNSTTPGYVTQTQQLEALDFEPAKGLLGGVEATGIQSARDVYAEQSVWSASQQSGLANTQSANLDSLQQIFDVTGTAGVPGALSGLYTAFSAWSASPSSASAQQGVLTAAQSVGAAFSQTVTQAQQIATDNTQQLTASVNQLNQDSVQVASINTQIRASGDTSNDAGLQAQLYTTLQDMSTLAPVTVHIESDGTATVLLGGQAPLVIGATQTNVDVNYPPTAGNAMYPSAPPTSPQLTVAGQDVTSLVNQGSIGGELTFANTTMPALLGNGQQQGSLNQLAQSFADTVNNLLVSGDSSSGPPAVQGVPLFTYTAGTTVAGTLAVAPIAGSQLAAIDPGPPIVANGNAVKLAALVSPTTAVGTVGSTNLSFAQFYGTVASGVGQQASTATDNATTATNILNQATTLRATVSGISLNDQAAQLLQYQEAYQASSQVITTVNTVVQDLLTASAAWLAQP